MAVKNLVTNLFNTAVDTPQVAFTATEDTKIDAFTAANNGTVNASFQVYIVPSGESVDTPIMPAEIVVWGENKLGLGLVGQVMPKNATLYVESSQTNTIYFTISGREIEE